MDRARIRHELTKDPSEQTLMRGRTLMLLDSLDGTDIDFASSTLLADMTKEAERNENIKAFLKTVPFWPNIEHVAAKEAVGYLQMDIIKAAEHASAPQ